ncbi:MAG: sulfite oxidase heme-binding subunit YedZ [Pseudooceanicola atlanticus]
MSRFSPYWLWFVLALPAFGMGYDLATSTNPRIYHILVHPSGETAARLLILALMATPLMMLFKGWRGPRWLRRNRRYLGVAAFGYAALHVVFYLVDKGSSATVLAELPRTYIWTGWIAFAIMLPLAATSMDYAVRKMGPAWKSLQRWTYPAAVLTLLHWAALHDWGHPAAALIHFAPLAALEAYRIWVRTHPKRRSVHI